MTTILLIIQLMISIVLIGLILIQRSEGGALGIGGGGGGGGLMSGRSSANAVTKATTILGTAFIVNCLLLSVFFSLENTNEGVTAVDKNEVGLNIDADSSKDIIPLADETQMAQETQETTPDVTSEDGPDVAPQEAEAVDTETPQ